MQIPVVPTSFVEKIAFPPEIGKISGYYLLFTDDKTNSIQVIGLSLQIEMRGAIF